MDDIFLRKAQIWNDRLSALLKRGPHGKLSQYGLATALNKQYGTNYSQTIVSRWLNVGSKDKTTKTVIGFPKYETMHIIAAYFGVDVGYLTGETDSEKFNISKSSQFLGVSTDSIKQIMKVTQAGVETTPGPFTQHLRASYDYLICSADYFELVTRLFELYCSSPASGIPDYHSQEEYIEAENYSAEVNDGIKMARFTVTETFYRLLDHLYPYAKPEDYYIGDEQ